MNHWFQKVNRKYLRINVILAAIVLVIIAGFLQSLRIDKVPSSNVPKEYNNQSDAERHLDLYVWKNKEITGSENTYFTLFSDNDDTRDEQTIYDLNSAVDSIEKVNKLLSGYKDITLLSIYQMNMTDFTKIEMVAISKQLKVPFENGSVSIGLWEKATDKDMSVDLKNNIEKNLNEMIYYPSTSSNPQDYMDAKPEAYNYIIGEGDEALKYLLLQFEEGKAGGLRGQIIMRLSKELLGDRNNVSDDTLSPYEWYMKLTIPKELYAE